MTGRVAQVSPVATTHHVQCAPERLAGHADDQVRLRQAGKQSERARRVCEVLQHLAAHHQLGAIPRRAQVVEIGNAERHRQPERGGALAGDRHRGRADVAAAHHKAGLGEHGAEKALAAADLVHLFCPAAPGKIC
jgi:hypothetical protein